MRERKKRTYDMNQSHLITSSKLQPNSRSTSTTGKTFTFASSLRGKEGKLKQAAACFNLKLHSYLVSSKVNSLLVKKPLRFQNFQLLLWPIT